MKPKTNLLRLQTLRPSHRFVRPTPRFIRPYSLKPSAKYVVSVADLDHDWDELFTTFWDSWKSPLQFIAKITFPSIGTGGAAEAAAFQRMKHEYLAEARANPDQYWLKVEDMDKKAQGVPSIAGGLKWTHYRSNPFVGVVPLPGSGFELGSEHQSLSTEFWSQLQSKHRIHMQRAHSYGHWIWILPEHRRTGAGTAIMDYWTNQVDNLGLEIYGEGTMFGTPLFLGYGFVILGHTTMIFQRENPTAEWVRLSRQGQSRPLSYVWRPKGGIYEEGKTILPWKGRPRQPEL